MAAYIWLPLIHSSEEKRGNSLVWETCNPRIGSKRFGLSSESLSKICRRLDVYWSKILKRTFCQRCKTFLRLSLLSAEPCIIRKIEAKLFICKSVKFNIFWHLFGKVVNDPLCWVFTAEKRNLNQPLIVTPTAILYLKLYSLSQWHSS